MAIEPGTCFGPYKIADEIGAGGMGVVYRATDTKLDREVAIKVLPESMASDAERIARFDREAKMLAALNHPNIAQIHGLEESDGTTALIMELVEGPTLADRIEQGAIPSDEALGIAMQIAEALEAAHGQNIVHRDLKPANIKLRPDGTVKVLDFGIAKALEPENLTSGQQSPILTTPATQVGVILGTAAYMSPEQARGKLVDERADIWAFGCVLYEMLTGQPVFGGEDVTITLARVVDRDTDLDSLPATTSAAVRHTIRLCLQKNPKERVADIRDVRLALRGAFEAGVQQTADTGVAEQPLWGRPLPVAAAAVLVTGLVVGFGVWVGMQPEPPLVNRFDYELPEGQPFRQSNRHVIALSPDGRHFVYDSQDGLVLRPMGELEARLIPGTALDTFSPFFSPDGQSVAYYNFSQGQLERIAISGGAPVVITEMGEPYGTSWEADGTILIGQGDGIYRVSATVGGLELIIPAEEGTLIYGPELLPDGDSVLFSVTTLVTGTWDLAQIVAQSLSTGERTVLVAGGSDAHYLPTGHLIYAFEDGLFAVAFDPDSLTASGGAVPLVQDVRRLPTGPTGTANYGVSENGTMVYVAGGVSALARTLVWVDREGREELIDVPPRTYAKPRISPDGTKLALDVRDQELDIWTWDLARETLTRLTFDPGQDESPVWSSDGRRIAYSSSGGGNVAADTILFWQAADGTGSAELLAESSGQSFPTSFLPDATGFLVYGTVTAGNGDDIAIFRFEGEDGATPLLETTFEESYPAVSRDGRWLVYVSDESGSNEIYVRPFPDIDAGRWQVSTGGGTQPLWARNGRELFYRNGEAVIAASIQTDPSFRAGNPEMMFEGNYLMSQGGPNYDVSPEDDRFLMIKAVENPSATLQVIIVENWFTELERLVPTTE